jgi:hypothetical protein
MSSNVTALVALFHVTTLVLVFTWSMRYRKCQFGSLLRLGIRRCVYDAFGISNRLQSQDPHDSSHLRVRTSERFQGFNTQRTCTAYKLLNSIVPLTCERYNVSSLTNRPITLPAMTNHRLTLWFARLFYILKADSPYQQHNNLRF